MRWLMLAISIFFSLTGLILLVFQGVEFTAAVTELLRDLFKNKT